MCRCTHTHTRAQGKIKVVESDAAEERRRRSLLRVQTQFNKRGGGRARDSNARSSLFCRSVAVREIGKTLLPFRKGKLRGASSEKKESTREIKWRIPCHSIFPLSNGGCTPRHVVYMEKEIWREIEIISNRLFPRKKERKKERLNSTRDPLVPTLERRIPVAR